MVSEPPEPTYVRSPVTAIRLLGSLVVARIHVCGVAGCRQRPVRDRLRRLTRFGPAVARVGHCQHLPDRVSRRRDSRVHQPTRPAPLRPCRANAARRGCLRRWSDRDVEARGQLDTATRATTARRRSGVRPGRERPERIRHRCRVPDDLGRGRDRRVDVRRPRSLARPLATDRLARSCAGDRGAARCQPGGPGHDHHRHRDGSGRVVAGPTDPRRPQHQPSGCGGGRDPRAPRVQGLIGRTIRWVPRLRRIQACTSTTASS